MDHYYDLRRACLLIQGLWGEALTWRVGGLSKPLTLQTHKYPKRDLNWGHDTSTCLSVDTIATYLALRLSTLNPKP